MSRSKPRVPASCAPAIAFAVIAASACAFEEGTPVISGVLQRDSAIELTRDYVLMRAVPDHPDGFEISRDYHGPLFFEASCPTDHLEFPFPYMLVGDQSDVDATQGVRWRVIVWETDDPDAIWPEPGQAHGTVAFHFLEDAYGSWAPEVDVVIDRQ